jgi:hypothetical protein
MTAETAQESAQIEMFTGELVDTRTGRQKQAALEHGQPQQAEMFAQHDLAQFGVSAKPRIPIAPLTRLELASQDPQTEDEKAAESQGAIEDMTYQLFDGPTNES